MSVRSRLPPRRATVPATVFVVLSVIFLLTVSRAVSLDVWTANLASWSIGTTGSPWPDLGEHQRLEVNPWRPAWVLVTDRGEVIGRAPGVIAAGVPAYWVAGVLGFDEMSTVPGGVTAALMTAAAATILFVTTRAHVGDRVAGAGAVTFALATPIWTVSASGLWPHTLTVLGIVGMAWSAQRERWWLVGLFGGVALWGRLHAAVICAVLGLVLAWSRRRPGIAITTGAVSSVALAALSLWNHWMYGSWDPSAAYDVGAFADRARGHLIDLPNHLGFWLSPGRGMLVWTPLLVVLAAALVRGWRDLPDWSRALVVGGLVYTGLQLTLNRYSGGGTFFGYRVGLEMLACLAPALILTVHRAGPVARRVAGPVIAVQFAVFLIGSLSDPRMFGAAEYRWYRNDFLWLLADRPGPLGVVLAVGLLLGVLAVRAWHRLPGPGVPRDQ